MKKANNLEKILFKNKEIKQKIKEYADFLNKEYHSKKLTIIGILNGAAFFTVHLINYLKIDIELDFLSISSYSGSSQNKIFRFYKDIKIDLKDKNVLILDDIIDTGKTAFMISKMIEKKKPKSIRWCVLLAIKNSKQPIEIQIDSLLKLDSWNWIVGFGLDYLEQFRHLPDIWEYKIPTKTKKWLK